MRITPTSCRLIPVGVTLTAKRKTAPTAKITRLVPTPISSHLHSLRTFAQGFNLVSKTRERHEHQAGRTWLDQLRLVQLDSAFLGQFFPVTRNYLPHRTHPVSAWTLSALHLPRLRTSESSEFSTSVSHLGGVVAYRRGWNCLPWASCSKSAVQSSSDHE